MAWGWKFAGVVLGGTFGGPLGAGIGVTLGHLLDLASTARQEEKQSSVVCYCVAVFLSRIAMADGHVDPRERSLAYSIVTEIASDLGLNKPESELRALVDRTFADQTGLDLVMHMGRSSEEFRAVLIRYGWRVAAKDGKITDDEVSALVTAARMMEASEAEIYALALPYYRPQQDEEERRAAAQTLGVPYDASEEEIKSAYRRLAKKYHPDRHVTAPPELRELASERFAAIHQAYQVLTEDHDSCLLYGLDADTGYLCTMKAGDIARCFLCGAKCRLPAKEHHPQARCPKCQALLLFPQEVAELLS